MAQIAQTASSSIEGQHPHIVPVEAPENVEMGGKILSIGLYTKPQAKRVIKGILFFFTLGILYLFTRWIISLYTKLTMSESNIDDAEWVLVEGADKNKEFVPLTTETTSHGKYRVFSYRLFKYFYDVTSRTFKPAAFSLAHKTCAQIHAEDSQGLTSTAVSDNGIFFGKNITEIPRKSCFRLLIDEILTPFYIFQFYSFIAWSLDDYAVYAGVIATFTTFSVTLTLIETMRTMNKLHQMSYYEIPLTVYRNNGQKEKISSRELVPGDVFEVPEGVMAPCDALLLNGTTIMNESMLTGESIPVVKTAIPNSENHYNPKEDKQYTLYAGTKCIQARASQDRPVIALVTLTGFTTVKGDLIRTMLFPKESNFEFYIDSFKFISILAFMSVVGTIIDLISWVQAAQQGNIEDLAWQITIKASQIITITVPPALPTCMQIGVSVALARLQKKQTFCISPNKINEAGRINVYCFDKTGTLTEDGLDILGIKPVIANDMGKLGFGGMVKKMERSELPSDEFLENLATCHSITIVNGSMIGDPLDVKMFEATRWKLDETEFQDGEALIQAQVSSEWGSRKIGIIRRFEFLSKLQRMSSIVKAIGLPGYMMHIKGSPEKVREMCYPNTIPANFHEVLQRYTENGYRVLACATKDINDLPYKVLMTGTREDLEKDFRFIGFLIVENRLKPITTQIIDELHNASIRTIMVTGDNVLTAISVARQCNIVDPSKKIFLGEMSEEKVNGKPQVIWRDFEFSANMLNEELEPEFSQEVESTVESPTTADSEEMSPTKTMRGDFDMGVIDVDPPFYNIDDEYCLAVTGKAFSHIMTESEKNNDPKYQKMFQKMLKMGSVYARMHPDEKALMITYLQKDKNNIVGMCGDGANDCGALKAANVGVSLSEAEASVAAPFTSKIQDISCIPNLLKEGRAALATSYQCFKYMALYSVIQFTSVTILYYQLIDMTNWHYYHQDIMAVLPFSTTMAMSGTASFLSKYRPAGRLISLNILTSVIGQALIQISFQIGAYLYMVNQPWLTPCLNNWETADACDQNTTLYLIGIYQYAVVALAFLVGRPFRKSFYTNRWFTGYFIFYFFFNLQMNFDFLNWQFIYNSPWEAETRIPAFWRWDIFYIAMVNSVVTVVWERVVVKYIAIKARSGSELARRPSNFDGKRRRKSSAKAADISMMEL